MAFEIERIQSEHVFAAVEKINNEQLSLNPSTGYDVIINGKSYPPKEIIRISYKLATGDSVGEIYGGEAVNKVLRNLGFEIRQKKTIWKLGCNWGKGAPSFYEFIKNEKIILSEESFNFQEGDLVIVAEGFTVYAIAEVLDTPRPITFNSGYLGYCEMYEIPYEDNVTYARAEWLELSDTDTFIYELQQGIRRVNKQSIKERTIDLWENRNIQFSNITFYFKNNRDAPNESWNYPCLILTKNHWNDHGYETSYDLSHYKTSERKIHLGRIKILEFDKESTKLPPEFKKLTNEFCSLAETMDYYQRVKAEFPKSYILILRALNDCAFFDKVKNKFEGQLSFHKSLLRSSEAQFILNEARSIIDGVRKSLKHSFTFEYKLERAIKSHRIDFDFNSNAVLSNRFFCLVGKNGTGKTKMISQLASKLIDSSEDGQFFPDRPNFSKVIAASFSYFDKFKLPKKQDTSYEFIGIKTFEGILSEKDISTNIWEAYKKISEDKFKRSLWAKAIENSLESEYLDFNLNEITFMSTRKEFNEKTEDIFSSGQKIVFHFITRLISVIEDNSLLIFDEPETHLHPNIAGRLLRTMNSILEDYNSFCILATHSPIIVQEMPSKFIKIIDRKDSYPIIYSPTIECFGENLSNISNSIFRADEEVELYKIILEKLLRSYGIERVEQLFANELSLNAKLFLHSVMVTKND